MSSISLRSSSCRRLNTRKNSVRRLAGILFFGGLLSACATPQTRALLDNPQELPQQTLIATAFYPQQEHFCGPAALATVLNYHGLHENQTALADLVYLPARQGSLQVEMLGATRSKGLLAYVMEPRLDHLLREVAGKRPVIVLLNLGLSWYPRWHYAVVIGYDLQAHDIILNSGTREHYRMPLSTFEHTWRRSQYWALLPLPPSQLPAEDQPQSYLQAAADLEEIGNTQVAYTAYQSALTRWPDNVIANMGLGNTAYTLHRYGVAVQAYSMALDSNPSYAPAYNNLAVALSDIGCKPEAIQAAQCAIRLDSFGRDDFRLTLDEVTTAAQKNLKLVNCPAIECPDHKAHAESDAQ